jgi:phosphoribosyl 1,2-cyclic phosphodiesterase
MEISIPRIGQILACEITGGGQATWLGHATFKATTPQNKVILIDPWGPPEGRQLDKVDAILVTHGHSDHMNDVVPTAQKFLGGRSTFDSSLPQHRYWVYTGRGEPGSG